jgi:hypothetical protein
MCQANDSIGTSAQRAGFRRAKLAAVAASLVAGAALLGADDLHGTTAGNGLVFTTRSTFEVTSAEVVEVSEPIWANVQGEADGESANGTIYWGRGVYEVEPGTTLEFPEGTPMPRTSGNSADFPAVLAILTAISLSVLLIVRRDVRAGQVADPLDARVVGAAVRLLPPNVRDDYLEEWAAWLQDLRANRVPWHRHFGEVTSIVFVAAPRLALRLRLFPRRPPDR